MPGLEDFFKNALWIFTGLSLSFILFIALFLFMFLKIIQSHRTILNTLKPESDQYFSSAIRDLLRWREAALSDLAASLEMVWTRFLRNAHARGTLRSLSNPEGPRWLAFEMKFQGGKGFVDLRTTQDVYRLEFNQPNRPKKILVSVNGTPMGTLRRLRENLTLSGSTGYTDGTYERYQIIRKGLRAMKTRYGLVELTGRPKIQLCNDIFSEKELSSDGDEPRAVFKDLSWRPSEDEEHWLMALVAWEIHNSIANTQRRINYGDMSMDSTRGSRWR